MLTEQIGKLLYIGFKIIFLTTEYEWFLNRVRKNYLLIDKYNSNTNRLL